MNWIHSERASFRIPTGFQNDLSDLSDLSIWEGHTPSGGRIRDAARPHYRGVWLSARRLTSGSPIRSSDGRQVAGLADPSAPPPFSGGWSIAPNVLGCKVLLAEEEAHALFRVDVMLAGLAEVLTG